MESTFSIEADHELKIIRYKHSGILDYDEIGKAWQQFLSMKEFTEQGYHLLSDYREAVFDMHLDEADRIVDFMRGIRPIVDGKKQSLIVRDPYSTAGAILFQESVTKEIGFNVKTFSSEEAALQWLLL